MLQKILDRYPDMRALLSSDYTDKHKLLDLTGKYQIQFLQKPYTLPKLLGSVREAIECEVAQKEIHLFSR